MSALGRKQTGLVLFGSADLHCPVGSKGDDRIAAVLLSSTLGQSNGPGSPTLVASAGASATVPESAATKAAREWVAIVDARQWEQSWRAAGTLFKSQVTAANCRDC